MTPLLFLATLLLADAASQAEAKPAKEIPKAAAAEKEKTAEKATPSASDKDAPKPPRETKAPVRLKRDRGAAKEKGNKKDEAPPVEPGRNIPKPGAEGDKPSDLDKQVLDDLGGNPEGVDDEEDPLLRAGKRMRDVEGRLARQDSTRSTRELQQKIVADLDTLLKKPPPSSKNSSKKQKQKPRDNRAEKKQPKTSQQLAEKQSRQDGRQPTDRVGPSRDAREQFSPTPEVKDIWGHLGAALRQEMSQYAREAFLEKYRDLLEQYYATIAEKGRRPEGSR